MAEIRALGHIPRFHHENALYKRWRYAKSNNLLSESQLAALAELPEAESREVRGAARLDTLMAEIRVLGHIPRWRPGLRDECICWPPVCETRRAAVCSVSHSLLSWRS